MTIVDSRAVARTSARGRFTKSSALGTVSATALVLSGLLAGGQTAWGAEAAPAQTAQAPVLEEITVTATRIVRDGYEAPTPTTVIGVEQIEQAAQTNIADYVNQLPALAGSASVRTGNGGSSGGTGGISSSNLRNLGSFRTLVLLDGHRVVGASFSLAPDIGEFPQALISRVDVVTGGASAAWGSDAVAGVVNFVLDKTYVGFKGEVSGAVTTYGDDRQAKVTLTSGSTFGGERGHLLISGEHAQSDGVGLATARPWYKGWKLIPYSIAATPAGTPQYRVLPNVGTDNNAPGGIVTNGPLKGLIFGPGGSVAQYNTGVLDVTPFNSGGDWQMTDVGFVSNVEDSYRKDNLFLRSSFDVTDNVNLWIEGMYGDIHSRYNCCAQYNRTFTIQADNAFLPASVAAAMVANKLATLTVGNTLGDIGYVIPDNRRTMKRLAVGANGKADAFDTGWNWNVYATRGVNYISNKNFNQSITLNINRAVDAVRNPATGAIVCRSTLTVPTNGCVPYNVFGKGVNSQAAINWSGNGQPELHVKQTQDVISGGFNGEPFSNWAGAISVAGGVEYRKEAAVAKNEGPISDANGYFSGNFHPTQGSYSVVEGFLETVVPLAKDTVWAKSLDLNGAVRATDYSLAGYVTTWKIGATYNPIDDLRFRATKSRDIRAPNLSDLFLAGQTNSQTVVDDFAPNAGRTFAVFRRSFGNVNLKPEIADTTGLGAVVTPTFFPGFQASFDYYNINISGAIATPNNQVIMDFCFQGVTALCQYITRDASGIPTFIDGIPINIASQTAKGFDLEASYRVGLETISDSMGGNLTLRALGTHIISNVTNQFNIIHENAGENTGSNIRWRWLVSANYDLDKIAVNLALRTISSGVRNTDYIECNSGCPTPTTLHPTINDNTIDGAKYWDFGITYRVKNQQEDGYGMDVFFKVDNVTNANPPEATAAGGITQISNGVNPSIYDVVGRMFHAGVRFKM